ncbi:MAG: alpha/beta fold hydrolase [Cyanophyceae cyanobacterium]
MINTVPPVGIGGTVNSYPWTWAGQSYQIAYETRGEGSPVLLLPAFSTVSTRSELRRVAERLSAKYQAIALDWLGFGESDRPPIEYCAALYHQLLQDFVTHVLPTPAAVVAAGHAAGYAMQLAQSQVFTRIVLAAPTWRGPFTVMGAPDWVTSGLRELVRSPLLGPTLYSLNTAPTFLRTMYESHVYTNKELLTADFIDQKYQVTQHPGGRYAPVAFVTGALDPVQSQPEFLALFQPPPVPVLTVIAEQAPAASKAEMKAIGYCSGVETRRLPGALGLYEEYADELADITLEFLGRASS